MPSSILIVVVFPAPSDQAHNGASLDGKPDIFKMEAIVALP